MRMTWDALDSEFARGGRREPREARPRRVPGGVISGWLRSLIGLAILEVRMPMAVSYKTGAGCPLSGVRLVPSCKVPGVQRSLCFQTDCFSHGSCNSFSL